ncbi:uncharacterized protein B0H18DRAFT_975430 [Fomitopsis serialis]|uniref:uncharacterized protein n=1 Tax=Fomitopsis serialis TaxID=139415 RepID=UPI0020088E97|nr:uncharacterized protein B0H18DRAFT_975430 [Neoantrodia serialis]KAH9935338.1 hypothetical protein B0H18DRAFT_975430 [Neoantrodia serialis]
MSKPDSSYSAARVTSSADGDFASRSAARLEQIQSQLQAKPRGNRLKGKVCIITGVGSIAGIGRAAALQFAREGAAHLYLIDFDPTNLPDLKSTIEQKYPDVKATTLAADAADEAAISGVCKQALQEEGRLDVFFANAGIATQEPLQNTTAESFMNTLRINTLSCFLAVKHGSEAMLKTNPSRGKDLSSGSIIMTASVAGLRSGAGTVDYVCIPLQKTDIRVNAVCPGLIETGMTTGIFNFARSKGAGAKIGQLNPMGRYGIADEIANVVTFLASGT